ncbi:MAG: hypothetical protein GC200_08590 [Tepidisphaera sp.]|nr:hypothetical protein [Tepidisphaera sp.]
MSAETSAASDGIPADLREFLEREIDPGEKVLWCGRPDASRVFRQTLAPAGFLASFGLGIGTWSILLCVSTWRMLHNLPPGPLMMNRQSVTSGDLWLGVIVSGIFLLLGGVLLILPFREAARARRTVYAVTPTRVMEVFARKSGLAKVQAVEPGHPLHIQRNDYAADRGDVLLYPRANNHALLKLTGVEKPREVERLIRATFDPPVPRP